MKSALRKKFGFIQQQNIRKTEFSYTSDIPCETGLGAYCTETGKDEYKDEAPDTDCVSVMDQYPECIHAGTRVFICIFSAESSVAGTVFYLWKYPKGDLTCDDLLIFPFFVFSGQQSVVGEALDEIQTAFPVSQEGYSGHVLYADCLVLFFSTEFVRREGHTSSMFAVAREEAENIGHVHGWTIHGSVKHIMEISGPYIGKAKHSASSRVFYRKYKDTGLPSQIEPLVRPDKGEVGSCSERLVCFVGNTKYVFEQDDKDLYDTIWEAWRNGYDSVYAGARHGNLWFLRDAHRACSLSVV